MHAAHPHVQGVAGGVGIDDTGALHDDYVDRLGHGTAVAAVIREKAPAAEILAVKVFDRELRATGAALVAALAWARHAGAHLVNLSLGTTNTDYERDLQQEMDVLSRDGVVIVCAAPDAERRWLPGALPGAVRVAVDMTVARDDYQLTTGVAGEVIVVASGYPRPIPGVPPERNLKGQSFAVANVTGLLARAWPDLPEWCRRIA